MACCILFGLVAGVILGLARKVLASFGRERGDPLDWRPVEETPR